MTLAEFSENWRAFAARPFAEPLKRVASEILYPPAPPARVLSAIRAAESVSEILVAWVQLAGVAFFLLLYAASHGAFDMRMGLEPVPVALTAYGAFVAWRLNRAYADDLSPRLLSISAVVDVTVLMLLIWSFTLQYDAPAALYLKGPTLYYAFILISLRALRFDPAHVLLTGGLAIVGWFALVVIAARDAPATTDYPAYMTSLSVLWGAEAEKLVALLGVTLVLALGVSRARTLLTRTAVEETAARDLSRFLDSSAAKRVRSSLAELQAGDGELKPATIMFLDLRGFSVASASLPPKEVIALLYEYQSRFVPLIEAAGGSVDKFLGDGILVSFGTGERHGSEAADAFGAVPGLIKVSNQWAEERRRAGLPKLGVAIAITHGDVVHGVIGYDDRLEFTVIGDAVNLAAKLEKHAKIENCSVIATRAAVEHARAQGAEVPFLRESRNADVDGAAEPVDLVIVA
ncbi:adenylate/guanylate cyclase domain-containing protein [Terricaulis sp.]|uniref:adenylate/guanylate cyclase domain-containing protein n=1 Tax=Terricaulis sp. TaxID=2768686 RepID=UPI003783E12C